MKYFLFAFILFAMACNCTKTENTVLPQTIAAIDTSAVLDAVPVCIKDLIKKLKSEPVKNPASKIYRYSFEGKTVYYMPPECCDNFSDLYNDSCKIIAHPDGGFTGKGDRKAPTFHDDKKDEKLIWEDLRK